MDALLRYLHSEHDATPMLVSSLTTITTVGLAFIGFIVNHASSVRRKQLEGRLAFVSAQLEHLYGPLYALVESNTASFEVFRKIFRPDAPLYDRTKPFSEQERAVWRTWAENVFIPSNLKIRDVIERNGHLVLGGTMPALFKAILGHIESSKLVLPAMADGDLSLLDQFPPWPQNFRDFVAESYASVVKEHDRLLGRVHAAGGAKRVRQSAPTPA